MKTDAPTGLVTTDQRPIMRSDVARIRAQASSVELGRSNEGAARHGTFMAGWRPGLRSADADWLFDRDQVVARARDASRNDVVGASAGNRKVNRAVGTGWRLASRVNARALGITQEQAAELRAQIDTEARLYFYGVGFQSDAERKKTFGQNLKLGAAHLFHDGEACATIEYASDEPTKYKTRLRLVDPDRLSNPNGAPDWDLLRGGVQRDTVGRIDGYWFREGHPNDLGSLNALQWKYWKRFSTPLGRPQVIHAFDEKRAGQSRGVSAFVSVLKSLRGMNKFKDSTIEAATINALMVAFVKSNAGPQAVSENFTADDFTEFGEEREGFYKDHPVSLGGAQIPVLPLGDEIQMQNQSRDTGGFEGFTRAVLRLIAAALGMTYEELSMDFSQTNYSSARAAMAIAWDEMLSFRGILRDQVANPFFVAWLEEAFDIGAIVPPAGAPDFYDAIDAYAECIWIAPGRGVIDPTKEVDAAAARIEAGLSTLEQECADLGLDWREVLEQRAIEDAEMRRLGLPNYGAALLATGQDARDPLRDKTLNESPAPAPAKSALATVHALARAPDHNLALEQRP
jgi:lambda family phage portal protein